MTKLPRYSVDSEKAALGAMLLRVELADAALKVCRPDRFFRENHRLIAEAVSRCAAAGNVDAIIVSEDLKARGLLQAAGGLPYLMELPECCPSPSNVENYAAKVREDARARDVQRAAERIVAATTEAAGDFWEPVRDLGEALRDTTGNRTTADAVAEMRSRREKAEEVYRATGKKIVGDSTGFPTLDETTGGFQPGHFWVVGAFTSGGKSFLALHFALAALRRGQKVRLVSLEMSDAQMVGRLAYLVSGVPSDALQLSEDDAKKRKDAEDWVANAPLTISQEGNLDDLSLAIRQASRDGTSLMLVDYLQLVRSKGKDSYDEMRRIPVEIQSRVVRSPLCLVALSQVPNEDARGNDFVRFKGAGEIAASADVAAFIRPGKKLKDRNLVYLDVSKNRHGKTGKQPMRLKAGKFEEILDGDPDLAEIRSAEMDTF